MEAHKTKQRDITIDIFRGIAMLMVVLQHTISGCASDYETSMLMNIVWTLQMPLFVIISGYVTRYSKPVKTGADLISFIKRRTCSYLIPWLVWTILVRGIIFMQSGFLNFKNLLWNMDSGYWFLFTIWTINMIFGISQYVSERLCKKEGYIKVFCVSGVSVLLAAILVIVGLVEGMSFLCIKLTLYYIPFFYAGFLFSAIQNRYCTEKWFETTQNCVIALSALIYVGLLVRYDFFTMADSIPEILLRVTALLTGSITVFGLGSGLLRKSGGGYCMVRSQLHPSVPLPLPAADGNRGNKRVVDDARRTPALDDKLFDYASPCSSLDKIDRKEYNPEQGTVLEVKSMLNFLGWAGSHSLEIYVLHGLYLHILGTSNVILIKNAVGFLYVVINYVITLVCVCSLIHLIQENRILNKLLFWKT